MAATLKGIFPALTTPFENGELSVSRLKSNIERYNKTGLAGYLVLGSTGEGILMNREERVAAIETVRSSASTGMTVIAGTGAESTKATIALTNEAADAGADYGLVVTPFYFKAQMNVQALEAYYREVAERTTIPILLYNVPKFTGLDLPLKVIRSLCHHPNIAGLKDSSGNVATLGELLKDCPPEFHLLQGSGSALFASLALGAHGAILALSDMAPIETVKIHRLMETGRQEEARQLQLQLIMVNQEIVGAYGVPGIKAALDLLGYFGGESRPPLRPVNREIEHSIRSLLIEAEIL